MENIQILDLGGSIVAPDHIDTDFIRGMSKKDDDFVIILNIGKVFSVEELKSVHEVHEASDDIVEEVLEEVLEE